MYSQLCERLGGRLNCLPAREAAPLSTSALTRKCSSSVKRSDRW